MQGGKFVQVDEEIFISNEILRHKRVQHFSLCDNLGDNEVDNFFKGSKDPPETQIKKIIHSETVDFKQLEEISKEFREKYDQLPESLVILQRSREKFFSVFFRNKMKDFSENNIRVMFAGECGVDNGGPLREFLRLAMTYFGSESNLVFGNPTCCFFKAEPMSCAERKYFYLGQLSAISIVEIGRGPECLHEGLVNAIFNKPVILDEDLDDLAFQEEMKEIDGGNLDILYEQNITSNDLESSKALYTNHYFILSRFAAINDYQSGIRSISPKILENAGNSQFFLKNNKKINAKDVIKLLNYKDLAEPGSNERLAQDDAMFELEFLLAELGQDNAHNLNLSDFLIFVTCLDRIPAFCESKIDVYFVNGNRLPEASTCSQTLRVPLIKTSENIVKGLKLCTTFSAV